RLQPHHSIGLDENQPMLPREDMAGDSASLLGEKRQPFAFQDKELSRIGYFTSRIVRDRVFRRLVP
ncbi:MAG: hypothetical protein PSY12_08405, partial [bacterium]|nr:hypothetical protein [bacterium]